MRAEADAIVFEATTDHGRLAGFGLAVLPPLEERPVRILTHCNTGPLACGQYGTALGIVQAAHHAGRPVHVWVDETRPYLQGARLTAWELAQAGVPHTLLPDVAAGYLMSRGEVDLILVGADRVAANGDTANKVGTYTLAVLAARHGVPFYVCAPTSSIDLATATGAEIVIEERSPDEVTSFRGVRIAPPDTAVRNPAFDVTPADLITGHRHRRRRGPTTVRGRPRGGDRGQPCPLGGDARVPRGPPARRHAGRGAGSHSGGRLMTTVAVGRRGIVARATTDKALLRSFLERDRLYAAYAICDLEEREFSRTRWGVALDGRRAGGGRPRVQRPDPAAAVRDGPRGRHRGRAARPHPPADRLRGRARSADPRDRDRLPGRSWAGHGPDVGRPRALPTVPGHRPAAARRRRSAT